MIFEPGDRRGSLEIQSLLGAVGMREVYKAKDRTVGRAVAINVLQKEPASDPGGLKHFEHEARSASSRDHPNIIAVFDIGEVEEPYFNRHAVRGRKEYPRAHRDQVFFTP
jgi:serine/threonine-protein kinase